MFDELVKELETGDLEVNCTVGDVKVLIKEMMADRDKVKEELLSNHVNIHKIRALIKALRDEGIGSDEFYSALDLWVLITLKEMLEETEGRDNLKVLALLECWIGTTGHLIQMKN